MTILLTDLYKIVHRNRGKAKEGFFRPTIGESFMTNKVFVSINSNHPPIANPDSVTLNENTNVLINLLANDTDQENDALVITNLTTPTHGTLEDHGDGTVTYTPTYNYSGPDTFDYTVSDGEFFTMSTASITINDINYTPITLPDSATVFENSSVIINLLANDTDQDNDSLTITNLTTPSHGTLVDHGDGTVTYTPTADYFGADSFDYTVSDGEFTNSNTVSITINNVNTQPAANPDSATCDENSSVLINLLANDTDLEGDTLTITNLTTPAHGSFVNHGDGTVTYTPAADYFGADSFDYTISDGEFTNTSTVSITVEEKISYISSNSMNLGNLFIDGEDVIEDEIGTHTIINEGVTLSTTEKKFGTSSMRFDGNSTTSLKINDPIDFDLADDFTIDMWFKTDVFQDYKRVIHIGGTDPLNRCTITCLVTGRLFAEIVRNGVVETSILASGMAVNTWYHLALTNDHSTSTTKFYINGVEATGTFSNNASVGFSGVGVQIGGMGTYGYFTGYLDNIRLTRGDILWDSNFNPDDETAMFYTPGILDLSSALHYASVRDAYASKMSTVAFEERSWNPPWTDVGTPVWVSVDMEQPRFISTFRLAYWTGYTYDIFPTNIKLLGSNDNTSWTTLLTETSSVTAPVDNWHSWPVSTTTAYRYWKLEIEGSRFVMTPYTPSQYWAGFSIWEFTETL